MMRLGIKLVKFVYFVVAPLCFTVVQCSALRGYGSVFDYAPSKNPTSRQSPSVPEEAEMGFSHQGFLVYWFE